MKPTKVISMVPEDVTDVQAMEEITKEIENKNDFIIRKLYNLSLKLNEITEMFGGSSNKIMPNIFMVKDRIDDYLMSMEKYYSSDVDKIYGPIKQEESDAISKDLKEYLFSIADKDADGNVISNGEQVRMSTDAQRLAYATYFEETKRKHTNAFNSANLFKTIMDYAVNTFYVNDKDIEYIFNQDMNKSINVFTYEPYDNFKDKINFEPISNIIL